jgi:signal transduction histidine kinase
VITLQLASFRAQLTRNAATERSDLDEPLQELDTPVTDIHDLSHRLHSSKVEHLGLEVAVKQLCEHTSRHRDIQVDFEGGPIPVHLPTEVSLCFYGSAQQSVKVRIGLNRFAVGLSTTFSS